jgi:hypothetical protein
MSMAASIGVRARTRRCQTPPRSARRLMKERRRLDSSGGVVV